MEVIESQHTMPQATASHTTLGHPSLNWLYVSAMPTGSVDFSRVWWRRDCHQSSFTSRTHKRFNWSWATHTYKGGLVVHWYVFIFFCKNKMATPWRSMKVLILMSPHQETQTPSSEWSTGAAENHSLATQYWRGMALSTFCWWEKSSEPPGMYKILKIMG